MYIIDLQKTKCPICENTETWIKKNGEIICKTCGLVIRTPYPYTAGFKINTSLDYTIKRRYKRKKK